jgi:hypothetical protein
MRACGGPGWQCERMSEDGLNLYMSQYLGVAPSVLAEYGAFDVSVASDLPLFVDPFLLFHSEKPEYQQLHEEILRYLRFLRDKASSGTLEPALIRSLFRFPEVRQNWLGFSVLGNGGLGLGSKFASALRDSLTSILNDFGAEQITRSSHLEKVGLIRPGVGRDGISDFTTNLIKEYLLEYTQTFARQYLKSEQCRDFAVRHVRFNYETEAWESGCYRLPAVWGDYVLLTPIDMLTRDDTWISFGDMVNRFASIPTALPNDELRAQVSNYFAKALGDKPNRAQAVAAVQSTVRQYPELLDYYIRIREDAGDDAEHQSQEKVRDTFEVFVAQLTRLVHDLRARTDFYNVGWSSYDEALTRARHFKHYVEDQDGWKLVNRGNGAFAKESEVQLYFGLAWFGSAFDVNREPNNGRGPVDFKISIGAADKSLIEFKLASNRQLKRNLQNQVEIYKKANGTATAVTVIIAYTAEEQDRVKKQLKELDLAARADIIVIDARGDNKPTGSKA